ncbi:MAG: squalene--hopene cyclase [Chloroflexi bacterium]|nr:squalene--hopene cyclase [Chloroflexota bacterium]
MGVVSEIDSLDEALQRSIDYFLRTQNEQGWWWGELETNVTMEAEYLLLTHFLGIADKNRWRKIVNHVMSRELPGGGWAVYYGGPPDLNATVEAYFALKLAGVPANHPVMQRARHVALSMGGVSKTRIFTKIWLALFGQYDWKGTPVMPPEIFLLPGWCPFNIYEFASWARATIVPMLIILTTKPVCPVPNEARIDEIYVEPPGRREFRLPWGGGKALSWKGFFRLADDILRLLERWPWKPFRRWAMRAAEEWVLAHQEADGSWGGIQPPWVYSLIALRVLGYPLDHPAIQKGMAGFEAFAIEESDTWRVQACVSPVWDTALAMIGLRDAGLPADHPALQKAARWLLSQQICTGGDWQVKNRRGPPGGWAFEFENDIYPDTDDTAIVLIALHLVRLPEEEDKRAAMDVGIRWLLSMQDRNGGWGSFDVGNTRSFVTQLPFCDFGATIDPSTEDVTGHALELLGRLGYTRRSPIVRRALEYLRKTQRKDGSWWGRWGVNYIYGTGCVLPAYRALNLNTGHADVRRAVQWLTAHQNADGGWGETCASYKEPQLGGQGTSTASQTAWALLALLAADAGDDPAALRGARFLLAGQRPDGAWDEPYFTGAGFPGDFFINYHLYRDYFPLMALGRYKAFLARGKRPTGDKEERSVPV